MIFNIVSGKGGTGKTLLCTVLAEMLGNSGSKVVVIDMDFAVRGLTALLYYYMGETYNIVPDEKICTYDYFESDSISDTESKSRQKHKSILYKKKVSDDYFESDNIDDTESKSNQRRKSILYKSKFSNKLRNAMLNLGIAIYRSFDVVPAVSRINKIIRLNPELNESEYFDKVKCLISFLTEELEYSHIIFDCRAGYDLLNATLHEESDITICVQEEDEISNITTSNLIRQFENDSNKPIYNLINKARFSDESYDPNKFFLRKDITYLGSIPFDLDVMKNFGKSYFWNKVVYTLYYQSVANIWNNLAARLNLNERIDNQRISPFGYDKFESRLGMFSSKDRLLLAFSFIISILGLTIGFLGTEGLRTIILKNYEQVFSFLIGISGIILSIYTILKAKNRM